MPKHALLVLALATLSCGGGGSPTSSSCQNLAGTYRASFNNSCSQSGTATVVLAQSGCNFTATVPGQGSITGTIDGGSASFTINFSPCGGSAAGNATVSQTAINGTYTGRATGFGCCDPVSGSFTLTRQ